jgi:hypothetical protein
MFFMVRKTVTEIQFDHIKESLDDNRKYSEAILEKLENFIDKVDDKIEDNAREVGGMKEQVNGHSYWLRAIGIVAAGGFFAGVWKLLTDSK